MNSSDVEFLGWQDGADKRGTLEIIWSCLFTVFLCVWTAVHLNVPAPSELSNTWHLWFRRTKWVMISLMLPEVIFGIAMGSASFAMYSNQEMQRVLIRKQHEIKVPNVNSSSTEDQMQSSSWPTSHTARVDLEEGHSLPKKIIDASTVPIDQLATDPLALHRQTNPVSHRRRYMSFLHHSLRHDERWSMRHAFFADMGGFRLKDRSDHEPYIIYANHINFLVANDYIELPKLSQHDISDRSKSNGLTKFLTAAQVSWLAVQVIVRVAQQLEVAYLEITTLSFVVCAIGTFASWYRKPYDVQTSMIIQMPNHFISDIRPLEKHWDSFRSSHPEACQDLQNGLVVNSKFTMLDVIFDGGGSFTNQFTDRLRIWRPNIAPRGTPYQPDRIRNDRFPLMDCYMFAVFTVVVFGYAAIHVAAWNSPLPTKAEQYLWRVSSLSLAGTVLAWVAFDLVTTPIIVVPFKIYLAASLNMLGMKGMTQVSGESNREIEARVLPPKWRIRLSTVLGLIYLPSRAFILIESFVALRSMPASVYQQVDWGKVVPHI